MKIRAITFFAPFNLSYSTPSINSAGRFLQDARQSFEAAGIPVQTTRLATPPFMDVVGDSDPERLTQFAINLENRAGDEGVDYVSIGPVIATTPRSLLRPIQVIPQIIAQTEKTFTTVLTASPQTGINLAAIQATARAIYQIGQKTENGFGNLRFGMLANVAAEGPFFPGAYHDGVSHTFALALEAADLAVTAIQGAQTLEQAHDRLVAAINVELEKLHDVVNDLVDDHHIRFAGIDFSLAPFPSDDISIAAAMEHLGLSHFGAHGTVFATAFLTNILKQVDYPRVGYNGIMLPVLEDTVLARRAIEGAYTVNDLMLYSTVCGTGLDTVPIPGDTPPESIAGLLLDVATLAVKLDKPLSARLLPIPGLRAGDHTNFDFEYFANSAVLPLKPGKASNLLGRSSFFSKFLDQS